jgi:cell division topological specificity factor
MPFYDILRGRGKKGASGNVAQERLRLVLAHDRANIPPGLLETLKDEIVAVISRHVAVEASEVRVTFTQDARESRLVADIPVLARGARAKR